MKLKKIVISILMMIVIISINTQSFAKYVFQYTRKAAEISIINN